MGKTKKSSRFDSKWVMLALASVGIVIASAVGGWIFASLRHGNVEQQPPSIVTTQTPAPDNSIRLIAMGDMLAHDSVNSNAKTANDYDYTKIFKNVRSLTSTGDIRFCNQEGLSAGEAFGITGYPTFNAPAAFPRDLQKIGCNVINLANNHMADKGQDAINATLDAWQTLKPLAVSGANRTPQERDTVHYIDVKGVKVAYLTFNEINNNTSAAEYSITMLKEPIVTNLMSEARKNADFVMVSVHWGSYEDSTQVGPIEEQWTKRLTDLGANVVIGTGPHVLQRTEWQQAADGHKRLVWYSIGNFLSAQLTLEERIGGIAMLKLEKTGDTKTPVKISKVGFMPTYMHYDWPAADRAAERLTTRTNLALYPLDQAASPLTRSGFNTTVAAQQKVVHETLGKDVTILTAAEAASF